ncbi:hypothetical protein [Streptomyces qinglanensis]|uniref:hypothetical protein n=1 Tax=Streptomyces qinglanensis TaxID=943816 RepID=UPI003D74C0B2
MAEDPLPGHRPRARDFLKRDLPDRTDVSTWCGRHEERRIRVLGRRAWVCLDCIRERSQGS